MKNTARQQEAMKQQTIGVEVEMNNIRRDAAAKLAADFFGTGRYKNTAADNGYYCWSAWDDKDREWKFQRDVSIAGPDAEKCEMVTPILTYDDIETLQELVRRLRKAGAKSDPTRGCGVHIHIGAAGHTPQSLRNLANIMASHEELLSKALKLDEGRLGRYCRPVDPDFLEALNKKKPTTMAGLADIWYTTQGASYGRSQHYNSSRYHGSENRLRKAPAEREPEIRDAHLAPPPRLHRGRVQDRKGPLHQEAGRRHRLSPRQSSRLKETGVSLPHRRPPEERP